MSDELADTESGAGSVVTSGNKRGFASPVKTSISMPRSLEELHSATIMMVDDDTTTLKVMKALLEHAGYSEFVLCHESPKAMDLLHEQHPDVLLLDLMMPEVSGFDILKLIREDAVFSHLPVLILTSSVDAATKLKALDLGATDFISKPVDPSELALRVRNSLAAKAYQDQLSYYDVLTNLPNRHLFQGRLDWAVTSAERDQVKFALLHIVFDDYKRITDSFGIAVGDEVLKQLAELLQQNLRPADALQGNAADRGIWIDLFYLNGAAFSVLLGSVDAVPDAAAVAQRLLQACRVPFVADNTEVYLTPSIGVAEFPNDATDSAALIKVAMGASSQAVKEGGGCMQFYSSEMNQLLVDRLKLEAELRYGIEKREFKLLYQPKVDVASGAIIGAEALIRWQPQDGKMVPPDEFIPAAEETGLIIPIGEWVLREACEQIVRWREAGIVLKMSVNISVRQFFESDLVSLVSDVLSEKKIDPVCLMLEITESFLIRDVNAATQILRELRDLGVGISIDDFGTGYSSLSYLKSFKADEVKIDRSFISDVAHSEEDQALVYAVTYVVHKLGFKVCAEGVEDTDQLAFLQEIEVDEYQGYYFSKPVDPDAFQALFLKQKHQHRLAS